MQAVAVQFQRHFPAAVGMKLLHGRACYGRSFGAAWPRFGAFIRMMPAE
jgi:hypothetical protein